MVRGFFFMSSASKVEELYTTLQKKSAAVYIQRSPALYTSSPIRTRLLTWSASNLVITSLADTTFHGKHNVVEKMKQIDPVR